MSKSKAKRKYFLDENYATTGWLRLSENEQRPNMPLKKFLSAVKFATFAACSAVVSLAIETCAARIVCCGIRNQFDFIFNANDMSIVI
jgi:hypothetical protein